MMSRMATTQISNFAASYLEGKKRSNDFTSVSALCRNRKGVLWPAAGAPRMATKKPAAFAARSSRGDKYDVEFDCNHGEKVDEGMAALRRRMHEMARRSKTITGGSRRRKWEEYRVEMRVEEEAQRRLQRHFTFLVTTGYLWLAINFVRSLPTVVVLGTTHLLSALLQGMLRK